MNPAADVMCVVVYPVFEDCDLGYHFVADSAKDQDEWSTALNSGRYASCSRYRTCQSGSSIVCTSLIKAMST